MMYWLKPYHPTGFLATLREKPVGFTLLYPTRRAFGKPPTRAARLWGGVLPDFRQQGGSKALLGTALRTARENAWGISVGPVPQKGEAAEFLQACGGAARQRYTLYHAQL